MSNYDLSFAIFGGALVFLLIHLKTKEKRDFILSIFLVTLAVAIATFTTGLSIQFFFLAAIVLSLIGDLLMAQWISITEHRTIDGVMAFGVAHIIYIIAFSRLNVGGMELVSVWPLILVSIIVGAGIFLKVGNNEKLHVALRISNAIYALIISILLFFVLVFILTPTTTLLVGLTAGAGIVLFIISDSVLAYNEFQQPIPNAKEIIAITYIVAQILLQLTPLLTY